MQAFSLLYAKSLDFSADLLYTMRMEGYMTRARSQSEGRRIECFG